MYILYYCPNHKCYRLHLVVNGEQPAYLRECNEIDVLYTFDADESKLASNVLRNLNLAAA